MVNKFNIEMFDEIVSFINKSKSIVFLNYSGIDSSLISSVRRNLDEKNLQYSVFKNRIFCLAAKNCGIDNVEKISGSTSFLFDFEDETGAPRASNDIFKFSNKFSVKGGIINKKVVDSDFIISISKIPSLQALRLKILFALNYPILYFLFILKKLCDSRAEVLDG